MFKLWSQTQPKALSELKPVFEIRGWNKLDSKEKHLIWKHLEWYFFGKDIKTTRVRYNIKKQYYDFYGKTVDEKENKKQRIFCSTAYFHKNYKAKNFAPNFLESTDLNSACLDFYNIFMNQNEDVVYELLSVYSNNLLSERKEVKLRKKEGENDKDFQNRIREWQYKELDIFANRINEVFGDFNLNVVLTRQGFIPKQEEVIIEKVFTPTLKALTDKKWEKVNKHLTESFNDYQNKDYSGSITQVITAVQAFLQMMVNGTVGKGNISQLLNEAQKKSLIPEDDISKVMFKNIESILAFERQQKGMAHPTIKIANDENARFLINISLVFIQHCLQTSK